MPLPDGIYVNLPMSAYRGDPAKGASDFKDILPNAVQWFAKNRNALWRILNPPSDEETAATRFGTALHCMVLEPEDFDERYYLTPETPAGLAKTKEDINAALALMGQPTLKAGQKLMEYEGEARRAGVSLLIDWREHQATIAAGREQISAAWEQSLRMLRQVLEAHSEAMKFLRNGYAEVSVFWTDEHGIRCKCRFDYLRVRTAADVKSYGLRDGDEPIQNFAGAIERWGYDFSAAHYMDCRLNVIPRLVDEGRVYDATRAFADAESVTLDFFRRVAAYEEPTWWWIACMTQGYPEVDTVKFSTGLMQFQTAQAQMAQAKATYVEFRDRFGEDPDVAWVSDRGKVALTDYNFMSARARDRGAVRWEQG